MLVFLVAFSLVFGFLLGFWLGKNLGGLEAKLAFFEEKESKAIRAAESKAILDTLAPLRAQAAEVVKEIKAATPEV